MRKEIRNCFVDLSHKETFDLLYKEAWRPEEAAMGNLWVSFPKDKTKYLDLMDGVEGFQDKNIRQFWLFLALLTENYKPKKRVDFINEIKQYSSSNFGHSVREISFEYIGYLNMWDDETLLNLVNASQHHYWRFQKSSREILKRLLGDENYREQLILLRKDLDTTSANFLERMLNE